jgi:phage baseplate assembly protein W
MPIGSIDSFSDIDLNMGFHPLTKDIRKKTKEDCIKQAVKFLLFTIPGERTFKPLWGCKLRNYLFEMMDDETADVIREEILLALKNFEKRIEVIDVIIIPEQEKYGYSISVHYTILGSQEVVSQDLNITELLERVR